MNREMSDDANRETPELAPLLAETLEDYAHSLADLDLDKTLSFYRDDAVIADLVDHRVHSTAQERRQWLTAWSRSYRHLALRDREFLPAGNRIAVKWTLSGEDVSGQPVCLRGVHMLVVDESGRIEAQWCTFHRQHPGAAERTATPD